MKLPLSALFSVIIAGLVLGPVKTMNAAPPQEQIPVVPRLLAGPALANALADKHVVLGFLEYRPALRLLGVGLWLSLEGSTRERFIGFGFFGDISLGNGWFVTPSVGPGFYSEQGGIDLGSALEFRSTLEVSCQIGERGRVGTSFGHFSNAGVSKVNPGSETVKVFYAIPFAP